uniref:Uncharacterized protein n=1 Tax=Timema douglasi TaxID=61478 RepID=A0A7R8ZE59_TIMDO|nr:unnamed protein product [Timema douglasi]
MVAYLKWVDFSQNPLLMAHREKFIYAHICASHFDASQFRTPLQDKLLKNMDDSSDSSADQYAEEEIMHHLELAGEKVIRSSS